MRRMGTETKLFEKLQDSLPNWYSFLHKIVSLIPPFISIAYIAMNFIFSDVPKTEIVTIFSPFHDKARIIYEHLMPILLFVVMMTVTLIGKHLI